MLCSALSSFPTPLLALLYADMNTMRVSATALLGGVSLVASYGLAIGLAIGFPRGWYVPYTTERIASQATLLLNTFKFISTLTFSNSVLIVVRDRSRRG